MATSSVPPNLNGRVETSARNTVCGWITSVGTTESRPMEEQW